MPTIRKCASCMEERTDWIVCACLVLVMQRMGQQEELSSTVHSAVPRKLLSPPGPRSSSRQTPMSWPRMYEPVDRAEVAQHSSRVSRAMPSSAATRQVHGVVATLASSESPFVTDQCRPVAHPSGQTQLLGSVFPTLTSSWTTSHPPYRIWQETYPV